MNSENTEKTCQDYLGETQDMDACVKITLGAFEGEWILSANAAEDYLGETYPKNGDGMGDYVADYNGAMILLSGASQLTAGDNEGEWAHDDEISSYGRDCFLTDEMDSAGYCLDYNDDLQPRDDCFMITQGRYEGELAHVDVLAHWEDECWLADDMPDEIVCLSNGEYAWRDDCSYCESCGEYYLDSDGECCPDNESDSVDHVNAYHSSPSPSRYGTWGGYAIGFEVEKKEINGCDSAGEYCGSRPLFCGVETDASCGVEAISHIYSLDDDGWETFRNHVRQSSDWLHEDTDETCGGHVNISGPKVSLERIRRYAGLVYALYRFRLTNSYSCQDKGLKGGGGERYCPIRMKRGTLAEFRLVSRVKNAEQIQWRFQFFRVLVECLHEERSFRYFMEKSRPLIREAYPDKEKRAEIRTFARHFNRYLQEGIIHSSIARFI
jgi:hypothetical protein